MSHPGWSLIDHGQLHPQARERLEADLRPGERVLAIARGQFDSALIGTDQRLFVFKRGALSGALFSPKFSSWEYGQISELVLEMGLLTGVLAVRPHDAAAVHFNYYWFGSDADPRSAANAIALLRDQFTQARAAASILRTALTTRQRSDLLPLPTPYDVPALLQQLASLRDAGIVSPEEFESKKAQLLARI